MRHQDHRKWLTFWPRLLICLEDQLALCFCMNSETVKNWTQVVAIILAGIWVLFEFILADVNKGFRVQLNVTPTLSAPFETSGSDHALRELETSIELVNVGDREGQIGIISVRVAGHTISDAEGMAPAVFPQEGVNNFIESNNINWSADSNILAYSLLSPSHSLQIDEKLRNDAKIVIVDDKSFDLISYGVRAQIVNACSGVSIFRTCYDFRVRLNGDWSDKCADGYHVGGVCGWFERRTSPAYPFERVNESDMRSQFDWREVQTFGLMRLKAS